MLYIVDGKSLMWRHADVDRRQNVNGDYVGGIAGSLRTLAKLARGANKLMICWEGTEPNWRLGFLPTYKASRSDRSPELLVLRDAVHQQCEDMKKLLPTWGWMNDVLVEQWGIGEGEGDDVVAVLASRFSAREKVTIYSKDRDLLQLVEDGRIAQIIPGSKNNAGAMFDDGDECGVYTKHGLRLDSREQVKAFFGVYPERIADFKALSGDIGDSIPGIKGIGKKKAIALIEAYPSLEAIIEAAQAGALSASMNRSIEEGASMARVCRIVAELPSPHAPYPYALDLPCFVPGQETVTSFFGERLSEIAREVM